jgi:MFS family permease
MSITSGLLVTKTGRYKIFPILGSALIIVALFMLSTLKVETPYWQVAIYAFFFGVGLGFTMQTVMVAVQNAVPFRDMGVATSSLTFTRSLGGAIGTAVFGAILNTRLATHLADRSVDAGVALSNVSPEATSNIQAMQNLPEPVKGLVLGAYTDALTDLFLLAVPFVVLSLAIAFLLKEIPLRTGNPLKDSADGEAVAPPVAGH